MLPYSSNKGIASLSSLIPVFVLIAGLAASVFLVQQQQEIREKAVVLEPCYVCQGPGVCQKIANPPYCNLGDSECFVNEDCIAPTATPTPTKAPTSCIADGKCIGPGDKCCSGKDYFDVLCPVTETRCGIKPTPVSCSVKSEDRGCGRNNCSQTSMWQLVTNSDCTITSRCFPNHPECAPTPTPTRTPTPTPTPQTCSVKYEDRGCGRSGCVQTSMWQLVTNADCTVSSRCVPNHPACAPTPTPKTCITDGKCIGPGDLCCSGENYFDLSCPVTETRCGIKPPPKKGIGGFCTKNEDCLSNYCTFGPGGDKWCQLPPGSTITPTPAKCEGSKTLEQCDAQQPSCAWYACSNQCLPKETSYVSAGCANPCPPLPGIPGGIQDCGFNGQTCETQFPLQGQLYMCQEGTWQELGELRIVFDENCSEEEKNKYRERIGNLPLELHTNETIKISCPDEGQKNTVIIDNIEYESTTCGFFGYIVNTVTLSCNDPICQPEGYYDCQYIVNHEFAHNQADSTQFWSSTDIASFNRAIGCRSDGKGSFSFEEKPVTSYGETDCAEAYAELIAFYVASPCFVANNPNWSRQYDWLITNPDSPFQGKELCK